MEDMIARDWAELIGRDHGPLTFRLIVQPLMAVYFAVRSGIRDAHEGRSAFFWTAAFDPHQRAFLLRQGWADIGKLFIAAGVMDVVYQFIVLRWLYPFQTVIVAFALAVVPYVAVRGLTNRVVRLLWKREA